MIEGRIYFVEADLYNKQDSINRVWQEKYNRLYLLMPVNCIGMTMDQAEVIEMPREKFVALLKYMDYEQQKKDSISFRIRLRVTKLDEGNRWTLIDTLKITKLFQPPYK